NIVRQHGYQNPVVLNCINWSWDCSGYPSHRLSDDNVILGFHQYANGSCAFDGASIDSAVGNLTAQGIAVFQDEWGNDDVEAPSTSGCPQWNSSFASYLIDWDRNRGGSGATAFALHWSDGNNMTNDDGSFNTWGMQYTTEFVAR